MADVPVEDVRALVRQIHAGAAQEAAAARIALAVWRRAAATGDPAAVNAAAREGEARLEALFDALAALEERAREMVRLADSGLSTDPGR